MQIEKINKQSIKKAIEILKSGGAVVYPTETSYGLGCDWQNKKAIQKIVKIKQRPKDKKFAVICAYKAMAARFFKFGKLARQLAIEYWPGPLAIVLDGTAVRVSSNDIARALSRGLKKPIVSTSANISGQGDPYDLKTIIKSFEKQRYQPDLVLDAGRLPLRKSSTIIKIEGGRIITLRQGKIKF
ncbi:MAG: threonylcarbamoyl-AMP synthase [Parcubacteria group bacterium CG10_big_fil_rev_8_21_14_0_10_36_14]|nr:MAG: threonylcarbamoyl-AMP synthase [Parcubacteria group bacterium CG10_big_fil_rev_8_21_14_0_10_36_14]